MAIEVSLLDIQLNLRLWGDKYAVPCKELYIEGFLIHFCSHDLIWYPLPGEYTPVFCYCIFYVLIIHCSGICFS